MVYLLMITPFIGGAIYGALFVTAGGLQFFLIDGAEFTSAFVYGGSLRRSAARQCAARTRRVLFTFVIPATATAYLPALISWICPDRAFLPSWLGWFAPLFAVWAWVLALLAWRAGIRKVHRSRGLT